MKLKNEIVDIVDNLILKTDGSVFALYEVEPEVMNPVAFTEKEQFKATVESWLSDIKPYGDFDIAMLPFPKDLLGKFRELSERLAEDTEEMAFSVLEKSYNYLMNWELCDYHYFISLPLKSFNISVDLKEVIQDSINHTAEKLAEGFGFQKDVLEGWEKKYERQREKLEEDLSLLDCRRLTTRETIFVNRYSYLHSLNVDQDYEVNLVENWMGNLGDKPIDFEKINVLELLNEEGPQYVAFLPIAYKPENASYLHLIERAQSLGFPVEVWTKAKFARVKGLPFNNVRTKARNARLKLRGAQTESLEADSVQKKSVAQSKYLVEDIEQKIDEGTPILNYLQTLVVSDSDLQMLKQKINLLMEKMKGDRVRLSRATPYQLYLFAKNRFGETLTLEDKNFIQTSEAAAFAEDLFFVTQKVGQDVGFYFGMIDNQLKSWNSKFEKALSASDKPVLVDILQANEKVEGKNTDDPHISVTGDTGIGKTFAISKIFFYASLMNCKTLYIDPKREKRYWYNKLLRELEETDSCPELQDYIRSIHFVTLDYTNPKNHGVLDPLVFLEGKQAKDLIVSMVNEVMPLKDKEKFETELSKMIRVFAVKRANGETVGTLSAIQELMKSDIEKVREAAENLLEKVTDSVLELVFSDGTNPAVDLTARNTILEIAYLNLPADEHAELTLQNRKAMAVMYALGDFCIKFGEQDYGEKTVIGQDEAWVLNMTAPGRSLQDRTKRMGRSQNCFFVFTSQLPDDSNRADGEASTFGTYLCFHNDAPGSAEKVLNRLKVEVTEESKAWFDNMTKGQCLMKDTSGRVERVTVDGLYFPEMSKLFETVRKNEKQKEGA